MHTSLPLGPFPHLWIFFVFLPSQYMYVKKLFRQALILFFTTGEGAFIPEDAHVAASLRRTQ